MKPMQTINNLKSLAYLMYVNHTLGFDPDHKMDESLAFWVSQGHLCDTCAEIYTSWDVDASGHMIPIQHVSVNEIDCEWIETMPDSAGALCDRCHKPMTGYHVIEFCVEVPYDCIITKEDAAMIYEITYTCELPPVQPIQPDTRIKVTVNDIIKVAEESHDEAKVSLARVYIANRNGMMSAKTWQGFKLAKDMLASAKLQLQTAYKINITEDLSRYTFLSRWSSVATGNKRMTGIRADGAWIEPEIIVLKDSKIAARPGATKPQKEYGLGRDGIVYHPAEKYNWCMGKSNAMGVSDQERQEWINRANAYRKLAGVCGVAGDEVFEFGIKCQEQRKAGQNPITKEVVDILFATAKGE
jgi:hypothetical protein